MARPIAEKTFANMLRVALSAEGPDVRLRRIAEKLVAVAETGEQWAVKEVADRLDGKPAQAIIGDDAADPINLVHRIERVIVNTSDRDGEGIPPAS